MPAPFNLILINEKVKEKSPYIVVCLQEIERMNILLAEIKLSIEELQLGLTGALNMTDNMELLSLSISYNKVPENWAKVAYHSNKQLANWFKDLINRNVQL